MGEDGQGNTGDRSTGRRGVSGRRWSREHRRQIDWAKGGEWEKMVKGTQATDRPGEGGGLDKC